MNPHRKQFSAEELERRKARLLAVRHLGPQAMIRKSQDRKRRKAEQKALVKAAAARHVFVPVESFE